jgi:hypothetical protein
LGIADVSLIDTGSTHQRRATSMSALPNIGYLCFISIVAFHSKPYPK